MALEHNSLPIPEDISSDGNQSSDSQTGSGLNSSHIDASISISTHLKIFIIPLMEEQDSFEQTLNDSFESILNDSRRSTLRILEEKQPSTLKHMNKGSEALCVQYNRIIADEEKGSIDDDTEKPSDDSELVTWDGENDPAKPMNWSNTKKWSIVVTTALMTFMVSFGSSVFSSTVFVSGEEFGVSSEVMLLGVALYVLGFAFGPMVWGPASELYGRTIPVWFGMTVFCIMQIPVAVATNLQTIFISRFLGGLFGSAPLAILAGMYVDFLAPHQLGISVALFSGGVFLGPTLGPIASSYLTYSRFGWRWTVWVTMIFGAFFTTIAFLTTPETFEPVLLRRKAQKLQYLTKNFALHAKCEEQPLNAGVFIQKYLTKPPRMLVAEPILIIMTIYNSVVYGILYLSFEAYPIAFVFRRGWSPGIGSLPFLGIGAGIMVACIVLAILSVKFGGKQYMATKKLNPEDRLPPMILGSLLLPIGLFWFAWTSNPEISWVPQVIAGSFIGCGIVLIFMTSVIYIVDVYLLSANSAIAINTFIRSIVGAACPMFATHMFKGLGVDWGASVPGFICIALLPFPLIFWKYGRKIRGWSKFAIVLPGS